MKNNTSITECICALVFAITMVIITIAINRPKKNDRRRPAIVRILLYTADWIRRIIEHTRRTIRRVFHLPKTTLREITPEEVPADIMREMISRNLCEAAKTAPHVRLDELEEAEAEAEKTVITVTV